MREISRKILHNVADSINLRFRSLFLIVKKKESYFRQDTFIRLLRILRHIVVILCI